MGKRSQSPYHCHQIIATAVPEVASERRRKGRGNGGEKIYEWAASRTLADGILARVGQQPSQWQGTNVECFLAFVAVIVAVVVSHKKEN